MDLIAVLIPCYNEELTIEKVVTDLRRVLPEAAIYVYDNNSTDRTFELAEKAGAVVRREYRQGKGNVLRSMFGDIDALCYITIDGDDTTPVEPVRLFADRVLNHGMDMVVGDRLSSNYYKDNKRRFHNIGNSTACNVINNLFGSHMTDVLSGYHALSYEFVKTFPEKPPVGGKKQYSVFLLPHSGGFLKSFAAFYAARSRKKDGKSAASGRRRFDSYPMDPDAFQGEKTASADARPLCKDPAPPEPGKYMLCDVNRVRKPLMQFRCQ